MERLKIQPQVNMQMQLATKKSESMRVSSNQASKQSITKDKGNARSKNIFHAQGAQSSHGNNLAWHALPVPVKTNACSNPL
jgi:hypothetical protein